MVRLLYRRPKSRAAPCRKLILPRSVAAATVNATVLWIFCRILYVGSIFLPLTDDGT